MNEVFLLKNGEIALKGGNRAAFEELLAAALRRALSPLGQIKVTRSQSTVTVQPSDGIDMDEAEARLRRVFGIAAFTRSRTAGKNMPEIVETACEYLKTPLSAASTFRVEARRSDKKFPLTSPEICAAAGEYILGRFKNLSVSLDSPETVVHIEIRDTCAYIHGPPSAGAGGLPTGSSGRVMLLLSGGIDSPVAGWMLAKRGARTDAVHFHSYPYTGEQALEKVEELASLLSGWCGGVRLHTVPFTEIQEEIHRRCPEELSTLIMRRFMMRISQALAEKFDCQALVTGESLGQVASQTIHGLGVTDAAVSIPVFRPLIGMDKSEIVAVARRIGTFETSILPYEDCCTVFTPRHPKLRPVLGCVQAAEAVLDEVALTARAVEGTVTKLL